TSPVGDQDRLVDTRAPREPLHVEEHSPRDRLHLYTHPGDAILRGPPRIVATRTSRLDPYEQPVVQDHDEEHRAVERICGGGARVDDLVGEETAPGEVDRVRLPSEYDDPRPRIAAAARRTSADDVPRVEAHERAA